MISPDITKGIVVFILSIPFALFSQESSQHDLQDLYREWRAFERPPMYHGAPDYRKETFEARKNDFLLLKKQLFSIDTSDWPIVNKVDWMVIWAEMNGYEFNTSVLKPWERDPEFYKSVWTYRSDVPAHEGPTHHMTTELWTYEFPLEQEARNHLIASLNIIPSLNEQAKTNLTGNARELWIGGIQAIKDQNLALDNLLNQPGVSKAKKLVNAIHAAKSSIHEFAEWLESEAETKSGPSGIGKENYTWYQQNVHLVPLTWDDEVMLLKRELARAWSSLKLLEHQHRDLPPLLPVESPEAYDQLAKKSTVSLMNFLDQDNIVTVKDYFDDALQAHLGSFVPKETRNFFWITAHHDPRPLYSHFYHWFELAREDLEPMENPIRQGPLLYNIFDSRNEGTATAVEEMFMQAGLYKDNPRVKEIVYIMIAQRAARGLGSLYAHANQITMEEAGKIHANYTPRGWMKTEKELLIFEQLLYMRQPGYGTSYITGKYLLENLMTEYARNKELEGKPFELKAFFDTLNSKGSIPISLVQWEMTGVLDLKN